MPTMDAKSDGFTKFVTASEKADPSYFQWARELFDFKMEVDSESTAAYTKVSSGESLGTGSKYGNEDIFGGVFGIGAMSDNHRFELIYTDYEDISLTSSVARTGVTTNNKIDADLDVTMLKASYGYKF